MMWRAVFTAALQVLALAPAPPLAAGSGTCQRITPGEPMDGNGCGPADSAVGNACSTASDCFFDGCRCEQTLCSSGSCQRITPGEPMDGNGCGPADSAVGNACSTASDCFFDGCRCEVVQLPCGSSLPGQQPPPPPRPPVGPPPTPCDLDEINLHCPAHGDASLVPDTCDGGKNCREVFIAWYDRCWAVKDVHTMLGLIPGAREQLSGFYRLCTGSGPSPPAAGRCGDLTSRAAVMNQECCDEAYEDCSSGVPAVCNADCASVLLPFFADCSGNLGAAADTYRAVVARCHYPDPCTSAPCANSGVCVAAGHSGHRRVQAAVPAFTCSCMAGFSGALCETALPSPPPPPAPPTLLRRCYNREVCCSVGPQPTTCNCACRAPYADEGGRR
jgi:hypothetical protein